MNQISEAVNMALNHRGMSIPQLAENLGMSSPQMYQVLGRTKRRNSPSIKTLGRVLDELDLKLIAVDRETAELLGGGYEL